MGNWAGVTVEKKTGQFKHAGDTFELTDLPGIYSLDSGNDSNSIDESIASRAILTHPADVIINVVDATSLERSLYMTTQLRELGRPMVVVLNKLDALKRERQRIDIKALEKSLGCPVLLLSATNKEQVASLKEKLHKMLVQGIVMQDFALDYGDEMTEQVELLVPLFSKSNVCPKALAIRALEQDALIVNSLSEEPRQSVNQALANIAVDVDLQVANVRYSYLHELCKKVRRKDGGLSRSMSEKIDQFTLNKWTGIPFFFVVMYLMFMFSINIGSAFIDFFDIGVGALLVDGGHYLLDDHLPVWLVTVLADGIGGGIQTVATFIPVIACLYLFLAVLESSGTWHVLHLYLIKSCRRLVCRVKLSCHWYLVSVAMCLRSWRHVHLTKSVSVSLQRRWLRLCPVVLVYRCMPCLQPPFSPVRGKMLCLRCTY
ncbi:ferrous iron transport protein B [Vibrio astriarenae]|nr:ferrous iron transport protein B [Vibrio sp. C7]